MTTRSLRPRYAPSPDYIVLGPIFPTTLKSMRFAPQGIPKITEWKKRIGDIPLVAIGGIKLEHASEIFAAGADSIAVVSDVTQNADPDARVRAWLGLKAGGSRDAITSADRRVGKAKRAHHSDHDPENMVGTALCAFAHPTRPITHHRHCEERKRRKQSRASYVVLDCFAEPVIGRRFAPTRWLAMTGRKSPPSFRGARRANPEISRPTSSFRIAPLRGPSGTTTR